MTVARIAVPAALMLALAAAPALAADQAADAAFRAGDFDTAGLRYGAALMANPHDDAATVGLGAIYVYRNDLAAARPLLETVSADAAVSPRARALLAEVARREAERRRPASVAGGETTVPFVRTEPLPVIRA